MNGCIQKDLFFFLSKSHEEQANKHQQTSKDWTNTIYLLHLLLAACVSAVSACERVKGYAHFSSARLFFLLYRFPPLRSRPFYRPIAVDFWIFSVAVVPRARSDVPFFCDCSVFPFFFEFCFFFVLPLVSFLFSTLTLFLFQTRTKPFFFAVVAEFHRVDFDFGIERDKKRSFTLPQRQLWTVNKCCFFFWSCMCVVVVCAVCVCDIPV